MVTQPEIRFVRITTVAVAVMAIVWWAVLAWNGLQAGISHTLFARRDVAAVHILSSLPLAALLVMRLWERSPARGLVVVAVLVLAIIVSLHRGETSDPDPGFAESLASGLLRTVTAAALNIVTLSALTRLILATWPGAKDAWRTNPQRQQGNEFRPFPNDRLADAAGSFSRRSASSPAPTRRRSFVIACSMGLVAAAIIPTVYVAARCRHDAMELGELLDQSRLGEARILAQDLLRLAPTMQWRGRSLKVLTQQFNSQVRELESQIAQSHQNGETEAEQLQRCQRLAMLGRTPEALAGLDLLMNSNLGPAACHLSGLIHETNAAWENARGFHRRAKEALLRQQSTPERDAGILQAATRLGYCERKLGNYLLAEAEYRAVLALSPTADSHFLLAQFYEDMQQSAKARSHARLAIALAPRRYQREGTALFNKLAIGHFGCLGVYTAESTAADSVAVTGKRER